MHDEPHSFFDRCPMCADRRIRSLRGFERQHLFQCTECTLVFDRRRTSDQELYDHYRRYSYGTLKPCPAATTESFHRLLSTFERFRRSGRILDIGCGQGDFLDAARQRGWDEQGSEYSEAAVALCRRRGLKVAHGDFVLADFGDQDFDVITAFEVIEHVNDPGTLIAHVRRLLRPGGLLYITTPNFDSVLRHLERSDFRILCFPEHLCFYTRRSLRHLAQVHGFEPLKVLTTGLDLPRLKSWVRGGTATAQHSDGAATKQQIDELRSRFDTSRALRFVKTSANAMLNASGLGDTLKGYFLRPN